jgi:SAM-dependent methyltransferase
MTQATADKSSYAQYFSVIHHYHHLRFRWIVRNFLQGVTGKRIAEIGAGDGGVIQLLREHNDVVGLDISETGIAYLKQIGIESALVDISCERLPFEDGQIDVFMMFEVFEHLKNPQNAVEELQRVVKPGGKILLSIPNPRTGHPYLYPALFGFRAFRRYLVNNGFTVNRVVPYGFVPPFWSLLKPFVFTKKRMEFEDQPSPPEDKGGGPPRVPLSTRLNYASSHPLWTAIKPRRYAWLCVYDLTNSDREGSRKLFDRVASRESHEERSVSAAG